MRAHKLNVTKADILKIIVEVAELELVKGSRKLLEKGKISKVIVTPHPPYKQEANNICNYLENFGHSVKVVDNAKLLYTYC